MPRSYHPHPRDFWQRGCSLDRLVQGSDHQMELFVHFLLFSSSVGFWWYSQCERDGVLPYMAAMASLYALSQCPAPISSSPQSQYCLLMFDVGNLLGPFASDESRLFSWASPFPLFPHSASYFHTFNVFSVSFLLYSMIYFFPSK